MIYEAVESLENRIENYNAGNPYSYRIRKNPNYTHLFTETEKRFHLEIAVLGTLLDKYELNDGYSVYRKNSKRMCLNDYMSAQFVSKIVAAIHEGGLCIKTPLSEELIKVEGFQGKDRILDQPLNYLWTDEISVA